MMKKIIFSLIVAATFLASTAYALKSYPMPSKDSDVIGKIQYIYPKQDEYIYDIARQFNVGYYELIEANPDMNRHSKLPTDEKLRIPTEYVLPNTKREGIVINLPELRLYYYDKDDHVVRTGPIAIGRYNWKTPTLSTKIIEKEKDPYWRVPKSIKEASARKGKYLPDVVKPGPKNPLGEYAMRLGVWSLLVHGTNAPRSIGKRASSGCMRMFPESIEALFHEVPVGTPVEIIDQPVKLGWKNKRLYMEVHEPLSETARPLSELRYETSEMIHKMTENRPITVDWQKVDHLLEAQNGVPEPISHKVRYSTQDFQNYQPSERTYAGW